MTELAIACKTRDSVINLVLDTLERGKQAIVFVGTKKSAEKVAQDVAKQLKPSAALHDAAEKALHALSRPTLQCEKLASCIRNGAAFHHAGLNGSQKDVIEEGFRARQIKVIACTPTLAYGVDLPAYRVIIRDVKRFGQHGMGFIPVLDYLQMAGRAGRPSFDTRGEAVLVADTELEAQDLAERYVRGEPEDIYSKLAVEPVLRTYVLSLIAGRVVKDRDGLIEFFSRTFWAYQYKDMKRLAQTLERMVALLKEWHFLDDAEFKSAAAVDAYTATPLGARVAQLYLDPLTAHQLLDGFDVAASRKAVLDFAWLHLLTSRLELRPPLRVGVKDWEKYVALLETNPVLEELPPLYEPEYDDAVAAAKTAAMFLSWLDERTEDWLLEEFNATPGELHTKLQRADWLLYASAELAGLAKKHDLIKDIRRIRMRLRYGVKEELLPLLQLEGVGRVRARLLFKEGIKDMADVKKVSFTTLAQLLGKATAAKVKKAVGEEVPEPVKETKRKGQMGLGKFTKE